MNAIAVAVVKLSVESIAESYISIYNIHNSDIRAIKEETAKDEMMIHINGPAIGEADDTLKAALDKYFNGGQWHFSVEGNIFHSSNIYSGVGKYVKRDSHRKLIIVFTKVEHSREDKDVPTWKDESILDRL